MSSEPPRNSYSGICSGQMIKDARKASGRSIAELAESTCIKSDYLEAMESGDRDALPERAFTLGFVRSYANALGLDGCEVVEAFKAEFDEQVVPEPEIDPVMMKTGSSIKPWYAALTLPLVGAIAFAMTSFGGGETAAPMMMAVEAEPVTTEKVAETPADPGRMVVASVTQEATRKIEEQRAATIAARDQMVLVASEDSWVQLASENGSTVWTGVLLAGETRQQPVSEAVYLTTGNAGGLTLRWGERTPRTLGERGAIVRDMALTPALLGNRYTENRH